MDPKYAQGWIKLHRSILDSPIYNGPALELRIWLHLLLCARHGGKPRVMPDGTVVHRGECYLSLSAIADRIKCQEGRGFKSPHRSSVHDSIKHLARDGYIEILKPKAQGCYTHIRILNWEKYQGFTRQSPDSKRSDHPTSREYYNDLLDNDFEESETRSPDVHPTAMGPITRRSPDNEKNVRREEDKEWDTEKGDVACARAREDTPIQVEEPKEATPPKASRTKAPTKQAMHAQAMASYKAGAFPLPEHLDKPEVREAFDEWLTSRESMRCWLTENAIKRTVAKLGPFSPEEAVHLLNQSADNNWKGVVFPNTPPPGQVLTARPTNGSVRVNGAKPRNERLYPQTTHEKNNPDWAKAYRKPQIVIKANGDREVRNG